MQLRLVLSNSGCQEAELLSDSWDETWDEAWAEDDQDDMETWSESWDAETFWEDDAWWDDEACWDDESWWYGYDMEGLHLYMWLCYVLKLCLGLFFCLPGRILCGRLGCLWRLQLVRL